MYNHKSCFLFAVFCMLLLCSAAQATTLQITVQDSRDNTTIPYATIFVNGANYAKTNNLGQATLDHAGVSDQLIRVSFSGYTDWEKTVAKNETSLLVNLSRKTLDLKVSLFDSDTLSPVTGARVNITGTNVSDGKVSGADGVAVFEVLSNKIYSLEIRSDNYQPRTEIIDMGAENRNVQYWLLSGNRFSIVVKDKDTSLPVPGAQVRIDSALAGTTDSRGILIAPVTRGTEHNFEITKPGYRTATETRTIPETEAIYPVTLEKAAVGLSIYVFDEKKVPLPDANVYFNGSLSGTTNEFGRSTFPTQVSGVYLVEVRKSGYAAETRTIVVTDEPVDHDFVLSFENAALTLSVVDTDKKAVSGATIAINGAVAGLTGDNGQLVTPVAFDTPLNITATKNGYAPAILMQEIIRGNATATATLVLEKNIDWGLITIIGAAAIAILIIVAATRMLGGRKRRPSRRRDEI